MRVKYVAAMIPTADSISSALIEVAYCAGDGEILNALKHKFHIQCDSEDEAKDFDESLYWFVVEPNAGYLLLNAKLPDCPTDLFMDEQEIYKATMYGIFAANGPKDLVVEEDEDIHYVDRDTPDQPIDLVDTIENLHHLAKRDADMLDEAMSAEGYPEPEVTYHFHDAHRDGNIWVVPITGQALFDAADIDEDAWVKEGRIVKEVPIKEVGDNNRWIAFGCMGPDYYEVTPLTKFLKQDDAIRTRKRIIKTTQLPWRNMTINELTDDENHKALNEELLRWDIFIFDDATATKMKKMDLDDAEAMFATYAAFASEHIIPEEDHDE